MGEARPCEVNESASSSLNGRLTCIWIMDNRDTGDEWNNQSCMREFRSIICVPELCESCDELDFAHFYFDPTGGRERAELDSTAARYAISRLLDSD